MEELIKDALPKEVIEVQEALPIPEPESSGLTFIEGAVIVILVGGAIALAAKARCCKKKKND